MKKHFIPLLIFVLGSTLLRAQNQPYTFSVSTSAYSNLSNSTSLNNGLTWDDPSFTIPVGFNFNYLGNTTDSVYIYYGVGAEIVTQLDTVNGLIDLLSVFGADLIDRGYDFSVGDGGPGSLSSISYQLSGTAGNRILKVEWNNAGFYGDLDADNISTDYIHFQLWLYEIDNAIEVHFGPSSVTQPNDSYDGNSGAYVALIPEIDANTYSTTQNFYSLDGNVSSPTLLTKSPNDIPSFLNGTPANGMVYRFDPLTVGVSEQQIKKAKLKVFPNPTKKVVYLESELSIKQVEVYAVKGTLVKSLSYTSEGIHLNNLENGIYFMKIIAEEGIVFRKIIKE